MKVDRLLALYDRVADAPDAVGCLRRFVLDLAVRGKLVEQDPADEPASELLKRIASAKKLVAASGRKTDNVMVHSSLAEMALSPPAGWAYARLSQLVRVLNGRAYKKVELLDSGTPVLRVGNLFTSKHWYYSDLQLAEDKYCDEGDLLYAWSASFGPVIWQGPRVIYHYHIWKLSLFSETDLDNQFLYYFLLQHTREIKSAGHGISMVHMTKGKMEKLAVPVPPLAEQYRIVAKVEELMALCDRLEEARAAREDTRERLTKASLARLTAPDADAPTFRAHARFAVNALPALTARADQVKQLRQTILSLAVRGRLVEQDPADEPASELLKRIDAEKRRLVRAGVIRKLKPPPSLDGTETSFNLPEGWAWTRLGHLSQFVTSGSRGWAKHYSDEGAIFVRMGNLSKDHYRLRLDQIQRVKPPLGGEGTRTRLKSGDILISITGNVGMLGLIPNGFGEAYINQHTAMVRPMPEMKGRYLAELFRSPFAQEQFNEPQRGIKNSFRLTDVTQLSIPLPPLAEQQRIVAKVDELMALCDQLEVGLDAAAGTRGLLLDSLLQESLGSHETTINGKIGGVARVGA